MNKLREELSSRCVIIKNLPQGFHPCQIPLFRCQITKNIYETTWLALLSSPKGNCVNISHKSVIVPKVVKSTKI